MTPWFHIPSLSGCCGEFLAVGLSGHCLTRSELCNGSGEERGCEGFSSLSSQEKSTSAVRANSLGRDPALEFALTWGVCGMGRGGRRSGQKFSLLQPTQFSFLPLLTESPLLQGCCYWMNPLSRSWLVSWENLVKVWQSKSLHRCVTAKAFLVLPHGEAVHTLVLPSRIQPDSAEVQNKKKNLPLNCALLCQKKK